jgi:DME family drug/metabolite transporter
MRGLARVPASAASVLTLLEPLVAVSLGVLVWKEHVGLAGLLGAALLLGGAWLVLADAAGGEIS